MLTNNGDSNYTMCNSTSMKILDMCNGEKTVEQFLCTLVELYPEVEKSRAERDLIHTLSNFTRLNAIVAAVIFFSGNIAPKLPYSKHTGLRLPWTVTDEETWVVAHRVLAYVSIPLGIAYIAGVSVIENFEILTLATIILWVGIPGGLSYLFFHKKCGGK